MADGKTFTLQCPMPINPEERILLAHGGGGKLMHELLESTVLPAFRNPLLETRHDGAILDIAGARLAFTTDSYVVNPLFFPGGDIGSLAINGTVNDLAMCGARPLYLSLGLILEEGLAIADFRRVMDSMRRCAEAAHVQVVTGDTKTVERGKGDGLFINTAGVGQIEHGLRIAPQSVCPGDAVLLSGNVGRHGIAVIASREGLEFEKPIESDCAPLAEPVLALIEAGLEVHCLRDLTRGGLATSLIEIAEAAGVHVEIAEEQIAVEENVRGACEILGFDPLYLANEGRFVVFLPATQAERALEILRRHTVSATAEIIGSVTLHPAGTATLRSRIGTTRHLQMFSGEQLPRIC